MASLDDFLKARDLDDLLSVRRQMGEWTPEERERITDLLHDWQDGQALSNPSQRGAAIRAGLVRCTVPVSGSHSTDAFA